jgi:hypothetical protein
MHDKDIYLESLKKVLNTNTPQQLDTIPLQISDGKKITD